MFKGFKYFWRILGATILLFFIVFFGLILLIVPGIYWAMKYQFVLNFIVDKDMTIDEAFKASADLSKDLIWPLFVFNLILAAIALLGFIALGVGFLVAYPVIMLAEVYVYRKLQKSD